MTEPRWWDHAAGHPVTAAEARLVTRHWLANVAARFFHPVVSHANT